MADNQIFASKEYIEYQAALDEFLNVFTRIVAARVEANQAIVETVKLQEQVLLNNE